MQKVFQGKLMKNILIAILFLLFQNSLFSQDSYEFELFPTGLHFLPFKANYQEARLGILYYPSNSNLKVDIGNNVDLMEFRFKDKEIRLTLSIEFMAYALSTSYAGNRLQIDAMDGFFGGNAAFSKKYDKGKLISRFRIIHNSAHLVDGHYDRDIGKWINNDEPIPFTKDFGEATVGYQFNPSFGIIRTYATLSYATLVRPSVLKKWSGYLGYELAFDNVIGKTFNRNTNLFIASQFNLAGTPKYMLNSNFIGGVKFGEWSGKGVVFYFSYYTGANPFSEYYSERIKKIGLGFFVDFI